MIEEIFTFWRGSSGYRAGFRLDAEDRHPAASNFPIGAQNPVGDAAQPSRWPGV
jgi:hypothetical protein